MTDGGGNDLPCRFFFCCRSAVILLYITYWFSTKPVLRCNKSAFCALRLHKIPWRLRLHLHTAGRLQCSIDLLAAITIASPFGPGLRLKLPYCLNCVCIILCPNLRILGEYLVQLLAAPWLASNFSLTISSKKMVGSVLLCVICVH